MIDKIRVDGRVDDKEKDEKDQQSSHSRRKKQNI